MGDYSHIGEGLYNMFMGMIFLIAVLSLMVIKLAFFPTVQQKCSICGSTDLNYNIKTETLYCYACWANDANASRILAAANRRKIK